MLRTGPSKQTSIHKTYVFQMRIHPLDFISEMLLGFYPMESQCQASDSIALPFLQFPGLVCRGRKRRMPTVSCRPDEDFGGSVKEANTRLNLPTPKNFIASRWAKLPGSLTCHQRLHSKDPSLSLWPRGASSDVMLRMSSL